MAARTLPLLVVALLLAGCAGTEPAAETATTDGNGTEPASAPTAASLAQPPPAASPAPAPGCAHAPCATLVSKGFLAEPWIAVDPSDPLHAVVAAFGQPEGQAQGGMVGVTRDGGATWTTSLLPPVDSPFSSLPTLPPAGAPVPLMTSPVVADTMAAILPDGTVLVAALVGWNVYAYGSTPAGNVDAAARPSEVVAWRSTDGGATFSPGKVVAPADGLIAFAADQKLTAHRWNDKPFLAVDQATGEAHLFWNVIGANATRPGDPFQKLGGLDVMAARSSDGGLTWSEPVRVAAGTYGVSAAAHRSTLLVTFRNPDYRLTRSDDGGRTWSEPAPVGPIPGPTSTWQAAPVALWDGPDGLRAALARPDGEEGERVLLQRSLDGGKTWEDAVVALPEVPSVRRNPALAVDPATGRGVLLAYQGVAGEPDMLESWVAPVLDGRPQPALRVSNGTAAGWGVFEYQGAAAGPASAYVAWTRPGEDGAPLFAAALRWSPA